MTLLTAEPPTSILGAFVSGLFYPAFFLGIAGIHHAYTHWRQRR